MLFKQKERLKLNILQDIKRENFNEHFFAYSCASEHSLKKNFKNIFFADKGFAPSPTLRTCPKRM